VNKENDMKELSKSFEVKKSSVRELTKEERVVTAGASIHSVHPSDCVTTVGFTCWCVKPA